MEKNRDFDIGWGSNVIKKMFRTMKVFICILVLGLSTVSASTFSQVRVSIDMKNVTLKEVFKEITKVTGYEFVYSNNELEEIGRISLTVKNRDLRDVLAECLKGTRLWYVIEEQLVVISPKLMSTETKDAKKLTIASGRVIDENKQPIPGVTVLLKGTSSGVTTGVDGVFFIMIPDTTANVELIFSFVGMKTQTLKYVNRPKKGEWVITMQEDLMEMDEVVVTGYQNVSRRELASAVTQVKASDIMLNSKFSIDQMLAGQVAGMMVLQNSGEPGATPKIRIRGTSSIIGTKAPLWVLDGIILDDPVNIDYSQLNGDDAAYLIGNAISGVNPRDIETITVLKDASATAIYGVQAANGVIVVTTKKGKEGKTLINYSGSFSINQRPSYGDFHLMNAKERMELSAEIIARNISYGRIPRKLGYEGLYIDYMNKDLTYEEFDAAVQKMAKRNTDWYDILFDNAFSHNHTLSISGGSKGTTYYTSIGYDDTPGTANGSNSKRYSLTMKLNSWLNERFYIGVQANASVNKNKGFHTGSAYSNPNKYAYETSRTIPCYDDNGELFYYTTRQKSLTALSAAPKEDMMLNILSEQSLTGQEGSVFGVTGKLDFVWNIWKGLKYEFVGSYSHQESKTNNWAKAESNYVSMIRGYNVGTLVSGSEEENNSAIAVGGIISKSETEQASYTLRNTIYYNQGFAEDNHVVSIMAASEIRGVDVNGNSATYYGWQPDRGLTVAPKLTDGYISALNGLRPTLTDNVSNYVSWIGSASYSYKDKITLNGNIRMDGSNKFGDNPKYRFLPIWSVAAKYTLSQEPFLQGNKVLSYLSFRGSYGIQGNVDKASSPDLVIQVGEINSLTGLNESTIKYLPNADLRWEKTTAYNFGVDFSLWDGRVSGTIDIYKKKGEDMIMQKQVSQVIGMEYVKINGGKMNNSGYEGNLRFFPIRTRDYEFSVDIIYSHNRNELKYANNNEDVTDAERLEGTALIEGEPLGTFYSVRFAGLNGENGYPMFYDGNGEKGYSLYKNNISLVKSGVKEPKVSGGFNLNFRYKNLRLGLGFQYALGGYDRLPDIYRGEYYSVFDPLTNVTKDLTKRWQNPGDEKHTIFPVLYSDELYDELNEKGVSNVYQGLYLYDVCDARVAKTDNLRLRSLSLSYLVPSKYTKKVGVQDAMIAFQTQNLFLIADKAWNGRDPESGSANMPIPKVYTFTLNVSF